MNKTVVIARNPRARFDYFVDGTVQAGICLTGSEVKGLRSGGCSIKGAFVRIEDGEAFVYGLTIPFQDDPARARKLLLHKREILELSSHSKEKGAALVPLEVSFERSLAKVSVGICRGKKAHDKRAAEAERSAEREIRRFV